MKIRHALVASVAAVSLALTSCSNSESDSTNTATETTASQSTASETAEASELVLEDNYGEKTISLPVERPLVTDNRAFELLADWGVKLVAAPIPLIPDNLHDVYNNDTVEYDLGLHRDPDLEKAVAAKPDLIWNGQRFTQFHDDFEKLVPDATLVDFSPRDGEPIDEEMIRLTTSLGKVFGHEKEADALVEDFNKAIKRAKDAYDPSKKVMALTATGGDFGFVAPSVGRTFGPLYDLLGLTPSLEVEGASHNHKGDDVSVEAIAESNPDVILIMDRDAAIKSDEPGFKPAEQLVSESEPLKNVNAVKEDNVIIAPVDTYKNENIITYTEILNQMADLFEAQK